MQHAVKVRGEQIPQRVAVEQVRDHELGLWRHGIAVPALQVVEHHHVMTSAQQLARDDRSDLARAPGDQELHRRRRKRRLGFGHMNAGEITDLQLPGS